MLPSPGLPFSADVGIRDLTEPLELQLQLLLQQTTRLHKLVRLRKALPQWGGAFVTKYYLLYRSNTQYVESTVLCHNAVLMYGTNPTVLYINMHKKRRNLFSLSTFVALYGSLLNFRITYIKLCISTL